MTRASPHSGPHLTIEDRHRDLILMVNNNEHVTWERSLPDESRCEVQAGTYVTAEVTVQGSRTRGRPRKFAISAEEQRERRRAQNRKAQRVYRERKDRLIGELQMQICALQQQNSQLHGVQNPLELQQANNETELRRVYERQWSHRSTRERKLSNGRRRSLGGFHYHGALRGNADGVQ
ncbi:hypothetical protein FOPG_16879 [Fusarium oxysporum f. sp. conglutinans race 2 54008]|uniref:BZIP domain-containing protein n=2 Tax=Fusarium oxysporum f. sp. conglutinans TaxID=100902 RepID=F9G249_FUSOF|nr:hypothetical protein FOXB_12731 [Fusarium oxysporum f. sp. conglutinans Fo5176]EXL66976.1 hypothetical protein FOPG_16879 [Fusarium oxysporum f. sp. conglutinans race 2 54008]